LLVHDRVDVGFASLSYYLVKLLGKTRRKPEDFLPPWLRAKSKQQTAAELEMTLQTWAAQGGMPRQP
jgi:hypothetical protein